eukprot:TRINITY_DN2416_c0_g1_i1.p1 TRINITY_DN2416_c0_g1~~TRINITY_DN2416_c0_g1_i1.p1  ORF type:complete len:196 (-),score=39.60 TRINITY_DN2416_c0_g1_i1:88-675(-)
MEYRIVVVGAGGVGKSAITVRFIQGTFVQKYDPTIEDSYRKQVEIDAKACMLDVMDTAGQEEYSALRDQYMKTGEGFILVYSVTSTNSFDAAVKLRCNILRIKEESLDVPVIVVGNKCDLENERCVSSDDGLKTAERWGASFIEASAKTNKNINEVFSTIVRMIDIWRHNNPGKVKLYHPDKRDKSKKKSSCVVL